jgi:ribosome-associated protein
MTDSKKMAAIAYQALDEKKGENIKILEISEISILADYFIIASGSSKPQLQALVDNVQEKLNQAGCHVKRVEGSRGSSWNLLDYGDLVVHIFNREDRLFFDLERIWSDGKLIEPESLK